MLDSLVVSVCLGLTTALIVTVSATGLAIWLRHSTRRLTQWFETLMMLPVMLPPTVIGFVLLVAFSPRFGFWKWVDLTLGFQVLFTFPLIVFGCVLITFPHAYFTIKRGLQLIPDAVEETAAILGFTAMQSGRLILIPLIRSQILSSFALAFGNSIGAFGIVFMAGGNIPGKTQTASIYLYEQVALLNWGAAAHCALLMILISTLLVVFIHKMERKMRHAVN